MNVEKDMVMEFTLEKSDIEPKVPEEEPTMSEALGEVPTDSKVLKTAKLDPSLEGINHATVRSILFQRTGGCRSFIPVDHSRPRSKLGQPRMADRTASWRRNA